GVFYLAIILQLVFYAIILIINRINLKELFIATRTPILTAFVTQSSAGTLPLTVDAAKKLNLNPGLYGFSLPLGATINMGGAAIRVGVSVIFAANIVGASLLFGKLLEIVLIGTLATIGTAGVPGAGIIMIATVFIQAGLPIDAVALLISIVVYFCIGSTCIYL